MHVENGLSSPPLTLTPRDRKEKHFRRLVSRRQTMSSIAQTALDGTCTRDPNMNLIIEYGLLGLVLGLGLGLGLILYCRIWRPLALPYMCPQPQQRYCALEYRVWLTVTTPIQNYHLFQASRATGNPNYWLSWSPWPREV